MSKQYFFSEITKFSYTSINKKNRAERLFKAKQKGDHTKEEWIELKNKYKVCPRCNGSSGLLNLEKDHIIPLHLGGSNSINNIQPLCAKCNASKTNETIDYRF